MPVPEMHAYGEERMTTLIHAAIGLLICACVLLAPHTSRSAGIRGSIAFSLLAGVAVATLVALEVTA